MSGTKTLIIGAGPAGLTAAHELNRLGHSAEIFEADRQVGGISRTVEYKGYRFDIGGHRFFSKVQVVNEFWDQALGEAFLTRPRLSRIFYNDAFFDYPLKPMNALRGLGVVEAIRIVASYGYAQLYPVVPETNFENWVTNRFGRRLYEVFFKTYTEKVWGMPCTEIGADWAAQRIKNLDLMAAIRNALLGSGKRDGKVITTLIDEFQYPRLGPGQLWERVAATLEQCRIPTRLNCPVRQVLHDGGRATGIMVREVDGSEVRIDGDHVISSMPVRDLVRCLSPAPPAEVLAAAETLRYRDFLTVCLICRPQDLFPDNWIYIHSPKVQVGRIQNFRNWSPDMTPVPGTTALGLEYFVQENDETWSKSDAELIALGTRECAELGLVRRDDVTDGCVIRMPKAYPVYDQHYAQALRVIRAWLARIPNLQLVGRNGQHRYNNQDHSMLTAFYAARNVAGASYDIWSVNTEESYHEEIRADERKSGDRAVPQPLAAPGLVATLSQAFARYDAVALGCALGIVGGAGLFLATAILLLRGGAIVGPTLGLLANFLIGYQVTWTGALVGLAEACVLGFLFGYVLARMINALIALYERQLLAQIELQSLNMMNGE